MAAPGTKWAIGHKMWGGLNLNLVHSETLISVQRRQLG